MANRQNRTGDAVILKSGRDKPVRQRHPWIFSGAITSLPAGVEDGGIVEVVDAAGAWLARGYLNRRSQIQVRLLTWDASEAIDETFWRRRLAAALEVRHALPALEAVEIVDGPEGRRRLAALRTLSRRVWRQGLRRLRVLLGMPGGLRSVPGNLRRRNLQRERELRHLRRHDPGALQFLMVTHKLGGRAVEHNLAAVQQHQPVGVLQ